MPNFDGTGPYWYNRGFFHCRRQKSGLAFTLVGIIFAAFSYLLKNPEFIEKIFSFVRNTDLKKVKRNFRSGNEIIEEARWEKLN